MSNLDVILPGVIWQEAADLDYILNDCQLPHLSLVLSKGEITPFRLNYSDFYYHNLFQDKNLSLATNYALKLGLPSNGNYMIVEPANLRPDRDRLLISESALLQLNFDEAQQILAKLNQHFVEDDLRFHYIHEELWLIEFPYSVDNLTSYPLLDIIGKNINNYLPTGKNQLRLHSLINEIQMLLFTHPINIVREQEGSLAVNSLWLWDKHFVELNFNMANLASAVSDLQIDIASMQTQTTLENHFFTEDKFNKDNLTKLCAKYNTLLIDRAYYPCAYHDSFAWLETVKNIDNNLVAKLFNLLKSGTIKQLNFWFNLPHNWIKVKIKRIDLIKFWRSGNYKTLVTKLHEADNVPVQY